MTTAQPRTPAGAPAGGQFTTTTRSETSTTLTTPLAVARFGPNGEHVQALLDRVAALDPEQAATLACNAPTVAHVEGQETAMFCPAGDSTRYLDLPRYRRLTQHPRTSSLLRPLSGEVATALEAADEVTRDLPGPSSEAVRDAVAAMVVRGRIHTIAYETLTRSVRRTMGRIHPEDGPLHR